jgi:hypothetical protein
MIPPFIVIYHHSICHSQMKQARVLEKFQVPHPIDRHLKGIVFTGQNIQTKDPNRK